MRASHPLRLAPGGLRELVQALTEPGARCEVARSVPVLLQPAAGVLPA